MTLVVDLGQESEGGVRQARRVGEEPQPPGSPRQSRQALTQLVLVRWVDGAEQDLLVGPGGSGKPVPSHHSAARTASNAAVNFGVPIPDQEPELADAVLEFHEQVAGLLRHTTPRPTLDRVRGHQVVSTSPDDRPIFIGRGWAEPAHAALLTIPPVEGQRGMASR
jgi:hypothetical protein